MEVQGVHQDIANGPKKPSKQAWRTNSLQIISNPDRWYSQDVALRNTLATTALELASACPTQVPSVIECLVKALCAGKSNEFSGGGLRVGGRNFTSRRELKGECASLLRHCDENQHLGPDDERFMLELLSYHPRGAEKKRGCIAVSVGPHPNFGGRCFHILRKDSQEDFSYLRCVENAATEDGLAHNQITEVLCGILQVHPSACEKAGRIIEENFPFSSRPVEHNQNWVRCVLIFVERIPQLSEYLMMVLIRRMVEIDVAIHRMEEETETAFTQETSGEEQCWDHMAQTLDAVMMLLIEFLERNLRNAQVPAECRLVQTLLNVFAGTVLLTHRVRCVQFLWFYLSSLRPAWAEAFLNVLLQTAYSPQHGMPRRLISFAYLASFVARATYINDNYALRTAQYISVFTRENLHLAEHHVVRGNLAHPQLILFLASVQALCYMLCFRGNSLAKDPAAFDTLLPSSGASVGAEAFTPVLDSSCRPLTRISRHVAKEFCRSIKTIRPQFVTALEQQLQKSAVNGMVAEDEVEEGCFQGEVAGLELFFPFDPYRLRHSSMYLKGLYQTWNAGAEDSDDSESEAGAPGGFHDRKATMSKNADSQLGSDDDASDADFTDAADVVERGFIPSVGPSPAFRPRSSTDLMDTMSPMCVPMESADDDDSFTLPQASVDEGSSAMLDCLLSSRAYKAG
eukprot:CAMPEP_0172674746 /NCGR_PEP_ID=MMETSP1074-20121228/12901_1 /TAXON_ID=2916 /ORGANISM="Ceratium fusus, Strain PA161109" /LENGTH=684 /DNA_ID=CAMNT_0013492177 /DNA_START=84 /DNA_END=2138 /DNA_ORIENTATION=+